MYNARSFLATDTAILISLEVTQSPCTKCMLFLSDLSIRGAFLDPLIPISVIKQQIVRRTKRFLVKNMRYTRFAEKRFIFVTNCILTWLCEKRGVTGAYEHI